MSYPREKRVVDLGLAAWIKMHGYQISKIGSSFVIFSIPDSEKDKESKDLEIRYVNSDATEFDSWLMTLKRTPITAIDEMNPSIHIVQGMGLTAWVKLKGRWRLVGRPSNIDFAFYVPEHEVTEFKNLLIGWTSSSLRDFDASMMAIKNVRITHRPGRAPTGMRK